jgi:hypothetical protein
MLLAKRGASAKIKSGRQPDAGRTNRPFVEEKNPPRIRYQRRRAAPPKVNWGPTARLGSATVSAHPNSVVYLVDSDRTKGVVQLSVTNRRRAVLEGKPPKRMLTHRAGEISLQVVDSTWLKMA